MTQLEEKHPLAIRWLHWVSFPFLFLMIWSGLLIYWANDVYRIGWGETTLVSFFPERFYTALRIPQRLAEGMALHFFFMWLFVANGLAYVAYLAFSGEWRKVVPDRNSVRDAGLVVLHDLHLRKTAPPQALYNAAQKITYTGVIVMAMGSVVTGLAIYKPAQLSWLASLLGGYQKARWEHFLLMSGFVGFFFMHIAQVIRAGWDNFRSMVAGYSLRTDGSSNEQAND